MARPCPACYEALALAGVKKVVYTTNDGLFQIERIIFPTGLDIPRQRC